MNDAAGFFFLDRALLKHPLWLRRPFGTGQAWVDLVGSAAYGDHADALGRRWHRGELHTAQSTLADRWGWTRERVGKFLRQLESSGAVTVETTKLRNAGGTLIFIKNYDLYQRPRSDAPTSNPTSNLIGENGTDPTSKPTSKVHQTRHQSAVKPTSNLIGEIGPVPTSNTVQADIKADTTERKNTEEQPPAGDGKPNGGQFWGAWVDANRSVGRKDPVPVGADTKAAKTLAQLLPPEQWKSILHSFLTDTDPFLERNGYSLRLVQSRVNAYLNGDGKPESFDAAADRLAAELRKKARA